MKKILLVSLFAALSPMAHAQLTLTGTSYYQNFDGIATGLPTGWNVADSARTNFLGNILPATAFFAAPTYGTFGNNTFYSIRGGFKNFPSADVIAMGSDSATQVAATDRALGIRQVAYNASTMTNGDPGAAFILKVANTTGFKNFKASFKLQSLDTASPRVTTWRVDYGFGAAPTTFTVAATTTTGTMTTGGHTFKNDSINVNFDTLLNNKSQNIWIRIVAVDTSTGSGTRATTTIDDFRMSWAVITPGAVNEVAQSASTLQVIGAATPDRVALRFTTEQPGDYKLIITDINGKAWGTREYNMGSGETPIFLNGLNLVPGMYVARISNGSTNEAVKIMVH